MKNFKAIVVENDNKEVNYGLRNISLDNLSAGDVLIKVCYSSLNFKDMLAVQKNGGVIRNYPMIPGIDLSGIVVESNSGKFVAGEKVLVTGFGLGMSHTGGMSEYARVPANWIVKLPAELSLKQAMMIGTAGFTAALSVIKLLDNGMRIEDDPEILVTGASGGVGSIALLILSVMGFKHINALVRKKYQIEVAQKLGATRIVTPEDLNISGKLLSKQKYNYVIDTVGGEVASELIPQIYYGGGMTMCGNAGGINLSTNVLPFILRGISLYGIDSVNYPIEERKIVWDKFSDQWRIFDKIEYSEVTLDEVSQVLKQIKKGNHLGRTIIKIYANTIEKNSNSN